MQLKACSALSCGHLNPLHRRCKIRHVKASDQCLPDIGIHKLQRNLATFTEDAGIDSGVTQREHQQTLSVGRALERQISNL